MTKDYNFIIKNNQLLINNISQSFIYNDGKSTQSRMEIPCNENNINIIEKFFNTKIGTIQNPTIFKLKYKNSNNIIFEGKLKIMYTESRKDSSHPYGYKTFVISFNDDKDLWNAFKEDYTNNKLQILENQKTFDLSSTEQIVDKKLSISFIKYQDYYEIKINNDNTKDIEKIILSDPDLAKNDGDLSKYSINMYSVIDYFEQLDNQLQIPFYQRAFSWDKNNIQDLLYDMKSIIDNNYNNKHFLGYITLHNNNIIDGQQRLTTLYTLLLIIYDNDKLYLNNELKIQFPHYTNKIIKTLTGQEKATKANKITDIFDLKEKFLKENNLTNQHLIKVLQNNFILIVVDLNNQKNNEFNEITIFETLNLRGKKLSSYDMIKSLLLASQDEGNARKYESQIEELTEENPLPDVKKLLQYFRHYIAIMTGVFGKEELTPKTNSLNEKIDIYQIYKHYLLTTYNSIPLNNDQFNQEIDNIRKYFRFFDEINQDKTYFVKWILSVNNEYIQLLAELKNKNIYNNDYIKLIITFLIRRLIGTAKKINSYEADKISHFLHESTEDNYSVLKRLLYSKVPGEIDDESLLSTNISYPQNEIATYILEMYEFLISNSQNELISTKEDLITLEHIHPKKFKKESELNNITLQLGNLTLLKGKPNTHLSNEAYKQKVKSSTYKNSQYIINQELIKDFGNEQTVNKVNKRTKKIKQKILEYFSI